MEAIKILDRKENMDWVYDEDADVLYISTGEPRKALGIDISEGAIVRYEEQRGEVVGLTFLGMKERLFKRLQER